MNQFSHYIDKDDPANEIFSIALDTVYDEGDGVTEHIERLSTEARLVYLLWCFDGEIHNGGFDQMMINSLGNHTFEILDHLSEVGATVSHSLLMEAISWFPNAKPDKDRMLRWKQHEIFCEH